MKYIIISIYFLLTISLLSQSVNINLNEPILSSDSLLKPLSGVISGPLPALNSEAPDLTNELLDIGVTSIRNNDYWDDRLDMERIFNCLEPLQEDLPLPAILTKQYECCC